MKGSTFRWALCLLAGMLLALSACSSVPTAAQKDAFEVEVDRIFATWADVNLKPDLERFLALWDPQAIKMASGKPTFFGPEQIRPVKAKAFETVVYDNFVIKVEEVRLLGEFGWARGTYLIESHPVAGGPGTSDPGVFFTVFRKQADGSWKVYRDTMMSAPK